MISKIMSHVTCVLVGAVMAFTVAAYYKYRYSPQFFNEQKVKAHARCVELMTTYGTRKATMRIPERPPRPATDIELICGSLPEQQ